MRNKGFTLAELIVVIIILSLLILLAFGVFVNIERAALESEYSNVVIDIENKAEEYARDISTTDVVYINVDYLISAGYIQADDGTYLFDPRDNSIMNCYMIHVILKDGSYIATLLENENLMNENGTCDETRIETGTVGLLCDGSNCNNGWYDKNITLSIKGLTEEEILNSKVEWTSLFGTYVLQGSGEEKTLEVSPNSVLNTTYNVTITSEEEVYHITQNIRIDKEAPTILSTNLAINYSGTQYLEIDANDMGGSGLAGYAITPNSCDLLLASDFVSTHVNVNQSGTLNVCVKDNAGNIASHEVIVKEVIFDYNNTSSDNNIEIPVYYIDDDTNYPLLEPVRNGYTFTSWVDEEGNRVYGFEDLDGDELIEATWDIIDVSIENDKIDKDTVGVTIENKINMILVLDDSGSMRGSRISDLKEVSRNLINSMSFEVGSTISIVKFTSSATVLLNNGTNASSAISALNRLNASGGTTFSTALSRTYSLIQENNYAKDETFVIFVSDGAGGSPGSYASLVRNLVNTVYSIGIGSGASTTYLTQIASPDCYFNSNEGLDSLSEIFTKIQDEIRETVTTESVEGLIPLPNLFITTDYPFILNIADDVYTFSSIDSISDILTINSEGIYCLDLVKIDNKYKLDGNFTGFNFTYYYE